ncbi:MAG: hypothetical protein HYS58_00145, partial [Elusimicrobia bacterium]|nr:hypothetical protein [Elusimicrobiota bacterium]
MNILLAHHHRDWNSLGFLHQKYYSDLGHDVLSVPLENTPYWTDWRNRLPFYIPKGIPVTVSSVEKQYHKRPDMILEYDSGGQYHLAGMKSAPA